MINLFRVDGARRGFSKSPGIRYQADLSWNKNRVALETDHRVNRIMAARNTTAETLSLLQLESLAQELCS